MIWSPKKRAIARVQGEDLDQVDDQADDFSDEEALDEQGEMSLVEHLTELRDRLLRVILSMLVFLLCLLPFASDIYTVFAGPLMRLLPEGTEMIGLQVTSTFLAPLKLVLFISFSLAIPVIVHQGWAFVAPGLFKKEKRLVFPLMMSSVLLFYLGVAFAYFVVFPPMFAFFQIMTPDGVTWSPDISEYLNFVLKVFLGFGIAFEVPVATILLVWAGVTTPAELVAKRPYIIVGAFIFAMMLTPPDVFSQVLLAIPVLLLFELGVYFSRLYQPEASDSSS